MRISVGISLLTLIFVGLKLGGVIVWPWFWVLAPWLIPVFILGALLLAVFTLSLLVGKQ